MSLSERDKKPARRSERTRDALLSAALAVFGRDGFHAASTRAIAEAAGVNQALIAYHFGGKEGLYLAVFQDITDTMTRQMQPVIESVRRDIDKLDAATPAGRRACLVFMDRLLGGAIAMFARPETAGWMKLVMREQQDPTEAFDIFYGGVYSDMLDTFTRLVGKVTGTPPDQEDTRILAFTLLGQILIFMVGRASAKRHLDWTDIGDVELEKVHQQVRRSLYARFDTEFMP